MGGGSFVNFKTDSQNFGLDNRFAIKFKIHEINVGLVRGRHIDMTVLYTAQYTQFTHEQQIRLIRQMGY